MSPDERAEELRLLDKLLEHNRTWAVFQGDHAAIQRSIDVMHRVAKIHGLDLTSG